MKDLPILDIQFFKNHKPCYDPTTVLGENWKGTILDLLKKDNIPPIDKIWAFSRSGSTPKNIQILAAISIVRLTPLKDGRKVFDLLGHKQLINALAVTEEYISGGRTKAELNDYWLAAEGSVWATYMVDWGTSRLGWFFDKAVLDVAKAVHHPDNVFAGAAVWRAAGASRNAADILTDNDRSASEVAAWVTSRKPLNVDDTIKVSQVDIIIDLLKSQY